MCRLLTYIGEPTAVAPLVFGGDHSLYRQSWEPRELLSGSVNADGYGVVWYSGRPQGIAGGAGDGTVGAARPGRIAEARPIWHDDELENTLSVLTSSCVMAALRNTTPGLPVDRSGLLPLVHGRWSFVLNGFVPDFRGSHMRSLRSDLPDDLYSKLRGSSDSETLFLLALSSLEKGASMQSALADVVERVSARVGKEEAQLNMVLSDGTAVVAVRASTVLVSNSLYVARRPACAPGGVVIASEVIDADGAWTVVDGHSWVRVDANGEVTSEPL